MQMVRGGKKKKNNVKEEKNDGMMKVRKKRWGWFTETNIMGDWQ